MLVIIPIGSKSDESNLDLLSSAIMSFGNVGNHSIKIASVPSLLDQAQKAAEKLRSVCDDVTCVSTEDEFSGGWFIGCNRMWRWTVMHLDSEGNTSPWFWMEPDCCPVKAGWLDTLANAYEASGKDFMGHVRPTKWKNPDGSTFTKDGDNMLLRNAVYPPMLSRDQNISPLLTDLGYADPRSHAPEPWDMYLRWLMFRRGVADSPLFRDHWKTQRYERKDKGQIVFQSCDDEDEIGVIEPEAVLIHGCKDGSLHRLIIGAAEEPKKLAVAAPAPTPVAVPAFVPAPAPTPVVKSTPRPIPEAPAPQLNDLHASYQKVLQFLLSSGNVRLSDVVAATKMPKKEIQAILPKLGYKIKSAGWVDKL
jgi:hypothetical protein